MLNYQFGMEKGEERLYLDFLIVEEGAATKVEVNYALISKELFKKRDKFSQFVDNTLYAEGFVWKMVNNYINLGYEVKNADKTI